MNLLCPNGCDPGFISYSMRKTEVSPQDGIINTEINCENCEYHVHATFGLKYMGEWHTNE